MHRRVFPATVAALGLLLAASSAHAQGFGVFEQSACAMGRMGAVVAAPCSDGSSIYFNPAGIVLTPQQTISFGATAIAPRGDFTSTGETSSLLNRYYPVPNVYYKRNFGDGRFAAGLGVFAPYGLTTEWPVDSEARYLGYKSLVQSLYVQPTFAYKISDKVAVGGGVDITYTKVELRQRADLSTVAITGTPYTFGTLPVGPVPAGTDFADISLKGHVWHAGVNVGVIITPDERVSLGVRYLSGQRLKVTNGEVTTMQIPTGLTLAIPLGPIPAGTSIDDLMEPKFQSGGVLSDQSATASLPLPDQLVAGVAVHATPQVLFEADYQFVRWSMFDSLNIEQSIAGPHPIYEGFHNTSGVRMGVDCAVTPMTTIRGGFDYNQTAEPPESVTPNLPEGPRAQFSVGLGQKLGSRATIDAYYLYLHQGARAGRTVGPADDEVPTTALNNGTFRFHANLFGVTLAFHF